ncbi:MAG TPA: ribonuclease P protein component [Thermomicrobiales bacterium]|nr:ribonuclease P protein component [Thermomicrobiales bacterium]
MGLGVSLEPVLMVTRELRLRRGSDIDRVRSRGRSWSSRLLVLALLPNDLGHNRYGFAVGKKVGGSVERNRAKRLMREVIRVRHTELEQGYDLLLIARNSFRDETTLEEVSGQLDGLLRKSGIQTAGAE